MRKSWLVVLEGAALLVGTVFGAGFLILPYTALKSGIFPAIFWLIFLGILVTILHLMYAEIALFTKGIHRLPGYAAMYLGNKGRIISVITFISGVFGGLLVYLILGALFLQELFLENLGTSKLSSTVIFWLVFTILILLKFSLSSRVNFLITVITMSLLFGLSAYAISTSSTSNLFVEPSAPPFFPYGIILFSLVGYLAIPEILSLFQKKQVPANTLKPVIILASIFTVIFSGLFMLSILAATGAETSRDAISGLKIVFSREIVSLALLLAFLEIGTSYLIFGISIRETLRNDFAVNPKIADFSVVFLPILFFLSGFTDFVMLVSILGSIWISIDSILITLIWRKVKNQVKAAESLICLPSWTPAVMVSLFLMGGIASLFFGK